jgi:hypothetical protein
MRASGYAILPLPPVPTGVPNSNEVAIAAPSGSAAIRVSRIHDALDRYSGLRQLDDGVASESAEHLAQMNFSAAHSPA